MLTSVPLLRWTDRSTSAAGLPDRARGCAQPVSVSSGVPSQCHTCSTARGGATARRGAFPPAFPEKRSRPAVNKGGESGPSTGCPRVTPHLAPHPAPGTAGPVSCVQRSPSVSKAEGVSKRSQPDAPSLSKAVGPLTSLNAHVQFAREMPHVQSPDGS
jgi:hypothetical protein